MALRVGIPLLDLVLILLTAVPVSQNSFKAVLKRQFKDMDDVEDSVAEVVKAILKAKEVQLDPSILSIAVGFIAELAVKNGIAKERKTLLAVVAGLKTAKGSVCSPCPVHALASLAPLCPHAVLAFVCCSASSLCSPSRRT